MCLNFNCFDKFLNVLACQLSQCKTSGFCIIHIFLHLFAPFGLSHFYVFIFLLFFIFISFFSDFIMYFYPFLFPIFNIHDLFNYNRVWPFCFCLCYSDLSIHGCSTPLCFLLPKALASSSFLLISPWAWPFPRLTTLSSLYFKKKFPVFYFYFT